MGFEFRKRITIIPGLYVNLSKNGLSSVSAGGRGLTYNIPVSRKGDAAGPWAFLVLG